MRYERSGHVDSSKAPWSRRRRKLTLLVAVVVVAVGATVVGLIESNGHKQVVVIPSIARAYLEANTLIQSLGSPTPIGASSPAWPLQGDRLLDATSAAKLVDPEHSWVNARGQIVALSRRAGAAILASQRTLAASVMTGSLLSDTDRQLAQIVAGEMKTPPTVSSPGGASIATWYSMTQHGNQASVDATLLVWLQQDVLVHSLTGPRLETSINQAEIEGRATLVRVHGSWKVSTLNQLPWQEAT
jgi:hypothetical protein